jgi:hypothetical protein
MFQLGYLTWITSIDDLAAMPGATSPWDGVVSNEMHVYTFHN